MAKYRKKKTAPNRQFGASGGAVSCDTSQDFGNSPPVRALPIPPPDAKLLKRWAKADDSTADKDTKTNISRMNCFKMTKNEDYKLECPELEAEIYYLTTEEGGRKGYVANGYRGQFYYNGNNWDALQEFIDKKEYS